jgi:hypothetical protein
MADVWYLAVCVQCNGGLEHVMAHPEEFLPMPFDNRHRRTDWVNSHMEGTGHAILLMDQPDRRNDDNDATKEDTHDPQH